LSKRWNVARVTSEISSSPKTAGSGAVPSSGTPATDPLVVAAKDSPATLRADKALLDRFTLEAHFFCDIKWFLLHSKCRITRMVSSIELSLREIFVNKLYPAAKLSLRLRERNS
jgi:hypothetical protein